MEENNKKKRRAYLDDFRQTGTGDYEYKGIHYVWNGGEAEWKTQMRRNWICAVLMAAAVIGAGCLPVPSMINCVYVILPFTVCFICAVSVIWGLCRLSNGGKSLRSYIYDATVEQIPLRAIGTMIGAIAAMAGQTVYLVKNGFEGKAVSMVFFLVFMAGACFLAKLLQGNIKKMPWKRSI